MKIKIKGGVNLSICGFKNTFFYLKSIQCMLLFFRWGGGGSTDDDNTTLYYSFWNKQLKLTLMS